jgi:hypothetical protein
MSNMLSPMEKPRISINFKRGDIVNARGQLGVIVDVLESAETDNICLYVRFVHNLGNARPYDMLELSPGRLLGVDQWRLATQEELEEAITRRKTWLDKEIGELLSLTGAKNGS